jgi:hypothetical protein
MTGVERERVADQTVPARSRIARLASLSPWNQA